jgi:hypothetical protein
VRPRRGGRVAGRGERMRRDELRRGVEGIDNKGEVV